MLYTPIHAPSALRAKARHERLWATAKPEPAAITPKAPSGPTFESIIETVLGHYDMRRHDLFSHWRAKPCVVRRHTAMYVVRSLLRLSFPAIGYLFGFDHASVFHAVKKIEQMRAADPAFNAEIETIISECRAA